MYTMIEYNFFKSNKDGCKKNCTLFKNCIIGETNSDKRIYKVVCHNVGYCKYKDKCSKEHAMIECIKKRGIKDIENIEV